MPDYAICTGPTCKARIRWARSATTGKAIPLDYEPTPRGTMVVTSSGMAASRSSVPDPNAPAYMPHHATCPDAQVFRRPSAARSR